MSVDLKLKVIFDLYEGLCSGRNWLFVADSEAGAEEHAVALLEDQRPIPNVVQRPVGKDLLDWVGVGLDAFLGVIET